MSGFAQQVSSETEKEVSFRWPPSIVPAGAESPALFSGISPSDYPAIWAAARIKGFTRGEILYLKGDSVQQVLLLMSGSVKITQFGSGGSEVILKLAVPGEVLGASVIFSSGLHYTTAQAFRPCRALIWHALTFKKLAEGFPILHQNMARILSEDLLELEDRFREVATERVGCRVARQLVRLHKKIGRPVEGGTEINLSREELAQMTGTTLFTVSRLLSAWEACGILKPSREAVTIDDVHALNAVAEAQ